MNQPKEIHQNSLSESEVLYTALDTGPIVDPTMATEHKNTFQPFTPPKLLVLKIGDQVELLIDIDDTLLKGNLGRVLGFYNATQVVISKDGSIYQNSSVPEVTGFENHPLVAFNVPLGVRELLIMRERFRIVLRGGQGEMYRTQLPLAVHSINGDI
ncbi:hypothetical protein RhiTH_010715 [Rhizoctonia solani]